MLDQAEQQVSQIKTKNQQVFSNFNNLIKTKGAPTNLN